MLAGCCRPRLLCCLSLLCPPAVRYRARPHWTMPLSAMDRRSSKEAASAPPDLSLSRTRKSAPSSTRSPLHHGCRSSLSPLPSSFAVANNRSPSLPPLLCSVVGGYRGRKGE
ncbi:hypothetical protein Dimus_033140, partial [Dionaea muscipula]